MITSNTRYPFGGKVGTVETKTIKCMVSTAKVGFFKKQSTRILDCAKGSAHRELIITVRFDPVVPSEKRLEFHDIIVTAINDAGESGCDLHQAVLGVSKILVETGLVQLDIPD